MEEIIGEDLGELLGFYRVKYFNFGSNLNYFSLN